jgi:chromosome segregation ATPase
MKHLESEDAAAQKIVAQKLSEDKELQAELQSKQMAVEAAKMAFDGIIMDAAHVADLESTVHDKRAEVERCRAACRELSAGIGHVLRADYTKPYSNFDVSAVKGYLARLVHIKDKKHALALEVAAGSKLYHLVVTTDQVGALHHGQEMHKDSNSATQKSLPLIPSIQAHVCEC